MSSFYGEILKIFPNLNWKSFYHEELPRVRFYFDELNIDRRSTGILTTRIISDLFQNETKIIVGVTLYNNENSRRFKGLTHSSLEERGLHNILEFHEKVSLQIEEDAEWLYYFGKISSSQILNINQAIIDADFSVDPKLQLKCYYFGENQHLLTHLYDDRGMDIISDSQKNLDVIFEKWNKIIPIKKFY